MQNILSAEQVLGVAWTLCLEIQFYLFFIALLALVAWRNKALAPTRASLAWVWGSGVASISLGMLISMPVYLFGYWYMFAGGVLGCWALQSRTTRRAFLSYVAVLSLYTLWFWFFEGLHFAGAIPSMIFAILIMAGIWRVGERGELETRVVSRVIQYFGTISYSLYLVHLPLIILIARIGFSISGDSIWGAAAWLLLSTAINIGAAHLFFVCIERPSMAWARSFKRR